MKKIATTILGICLSIAMFGQTKSEVKKMPNAQSPVNEETKQITYSRTFQSEFADSILYKRAVHWYMTENKSMRIQNENCVANQKISGRGECDLMGMKDGNEQHKEGRLKFTVNTVIKDGKVTVEITRFNIQDAKFNPVEPWIKLQETDLKYKYYLIFMEEYANSFLDTFVASVNIKKAK